MGMFDFIFGDEEEVDPKEKKALDYYKKHGKVPRTAKGWYIDYIPKSLGSMDRQNWQMQTDGALQVK
jgi:hypothetical protein